MKERLLAIIAIIVVCGGAVACALVGVYGMVELTFCVLGY